MIAHASNFLIILAVFLIVVIGCDGGSAINGVIYDQNGSPIANAEVLFEAVSKGEPKESYQCRTHTDKSGGFHCSFVHAPWNIQLRLTIVKEGFRPKSLEFSSNEVHEKLERKEDYKILLEPQ